MDQQERDMRRLGWKKVGIGMYQQIDPDEIDWTTELTEEEKKLIADPLNYTHRLR